jgi:hypothetical protein
MTELYQNTQKALEIQYRHMSAIFFEDIVCQVTFFTISTFSHLRNYVSHIVPVLDSY